MDHKYIEQLLDRYWQGETSLEEEQILRAFFSQRDLPEHLAPYADLFAYYAEARQEGLSDEAAERVDALLGTPQTRPVHVSIAGRLSPLLKAAAIVAVVLTIALAAEQAIRPHNEPYDTLPAVDGTYVRAQEVEEVIHGALYRNDVQTAAISSDSLSKTLPPTTGD